MKFESNDAQEEDTIIWFFRENLKLLIKVEFKQHDREVDNFEKIAKKAVNAEAKTGLQPHSYTHETNKNCARSNCLATAKFHAQGSSIKDPRGEEPKA